MKLGILSLVLLIASCAPTTTPRSTPPASSGVTANTPENSGTGVSGSGKPVISYSQDAVECERKAALASAGKKGEAFAACMRGRGYTPGK